MNGSTEYPSNYADEIEEYVRRNVKLSTLAWHLYAGLRWAERENESGFCRTIYTTYRKLAVVTRINVKSVRKATEELHAAGLVSLFVTRQGTEIRRLKILAEGFADEGNHKA